MQVGQNGPHTSENVNWQDTTTCSGPSSDSVRWGAKKLASRACMRKLLAIFFSRTPPQPQNPRYFGVGVGVGVGCGFLHPETHAQSSVLMLPLELLLQVQRLPSGAVHVQWPALL